MAFGSGYRKAKMNEIIIRARWEHGKKATIGFYNKKCRWKFRRYNKIFQLLDYFGPMIGNKTEVSIADLGAGMVSSIGSTWPGVKVKMFASDVLANEFNEILKYKNKRWGKNLNNGYKPIIPIVYEDMENLSYPDNFFDIVHCVNALDHCADPFKAIKEMYRVCKAGGWIYLRHFSENASLQQFHGLHQWNLTVQPNDLGNSCLFESVDSNFMLSDCISGFKTELRKELENEPDNMIISKLQK